VIALASSGYKDVTVANYIKLRYSWTAGTQNIANNYTPVSWKLQLISSNSSANINSSASKDYSVTTDGTTKSGTNTVGLSGGATKTLASGTKNIYHNSDGTKTFNYSFSQEFGITYSGEPVGTISGSGSGTLNTIPRGSVLGSISAFTIGNAINIPITKYSSSFADTLTISVGGTTIKTISDITNGYDVSFTATELNNIYAKLPSATSGTFTFKLTTKSGSTTIGTSTKTVKGTIPSTIKPSISSVSLSEYVSGIASKFGAYIQGKSRISGTINASAGSGSSIDSYKIVINGATYTSRTFTTGVLKTSGSNSYTATVIDKRGRSATLSGTFSVLAYTEPTISKFTVVRSNADGTDNDEGTYAKINASATISSLSSKNDKSFVLRYRIKGSSTWTNVETYTSGYTYTATNKLIPNINVDSAYDFQLVATDYFNSDDPTEKGLSLSTAYTILDIKANGKGIAFGRVATEDNLLDNGFAETTLSDYTFMGGERRSDNEKNLIFQSSNTGEYNHNCKVYGGNGASSTSIGMWDSVNAHLIYRYLCSLEEFHFSTDMKILQGGKPILIEALFNNGENSGNFRLNNGFCIQWGKVSVTPEAANTTYNMAVKFPTAFSTKPAVFIIGQSSVPQNFSFAIGQGGTDVGAFDIYINRTTATATSFHWVAIGKV
jgi:hypothetical protein